MLLFSKCTYFKFGTRNNHFNIIKYNLFKYYFTLHSNCACVIVRNNVIFRLNDELRSEYRQQSERFENMRVKYDEKFSILSEENKRLQDALPAETTD